MVSDASSNKNDKKKVTAIQEEETVVVSIKSYTKYLFFTRSNVYFFALTIFLLVFVEGLNLVYFRILAQYENITAGLPGNWINNSKDYWMTLGLLQIAYFIFSNFKYFLINLIVLNSN